MQFIAQSRILVLLLQVDWALQLPGNNSLKKINFYSFIWKRLVLFEWHIFFFCVFILISFYEKALKRNV